MERLQYPYNVENENLIVLYNVFVSFVKLNNNAE